MLLHVVHILVLEWQHTIDVFAFWARKNFQTFFVKAVERQSHIIRMEINGMIPHYKRGSFKMESRAGFDSLHVEELKGGLPSTAGGYIERLRFGPFLLFAALFSLVVYCPVAHWVWARPFLFPFHGMPPVCPYVEAGDRMLLPVTAQGLAVVESPLLDEPA